MTKKAQSDIEPVSFNAIRVESVISRLPVHRLATRGNVAIDLREMNDHGVTTLSWKVDYSATYGQPGPLAYKLDTLIINRRIEEARPRVPKLLRLGSLSELCKELGLADSGKNRAGIKKALLQNAFAGIVPEMRYTSEDGSECTLDTGFNRYSVILTGKKLPTGQKANAVYIVLNDIFMQVLSGAKTRPLDYDYLKILPPVSQRFYEILSYRMYGTLKHERARAKLIYSQLCSYAPQTRHDSQKLMRYQMKQVHKKHLESGYLAEANYQEITDQDGKLDWIMLYKPGPKARAEFRAVEKRGGLNVLEVEPFDPTASAFTLQLPPPESASPLAAALESRGISAKTIKELLAHTPAEVIQSQIECFDWLTERNDKRVAKSPAGYLAKAILENWNPPKGFTSKAEQEQQAETKRQADMQAAEIRRRDHAAEAEERATAAKVAAYLKRQSPPQLAQLEADAIAQANDDMRRSLDDPAITPVRKTLILGLVREHVSRLIAQESTPLESA